MRPMCFVTACESRKKSQRLKPNVCVVGDCAIKGIPNSDVVRDEQHVDLCSLSSNGELAIVL